MTTRVTATYRTDDDERTSGEVFSRWVDEAEKHWRAGDYRWMAEYAKGERVLEVGCGAGYSTLALAQAADSVLVLEPNAQCRAHAQRLLATEVAPFIPGFLDADVCAIDDATKSKIDSFSPSAVVCWLMGSAKMRSPSPSEQREIRLAIHRKVGELGTKLPSVSTIHFADRTAFPWQLKSTARETLTYLHNSGTLIGLPFSCSYEDATFRKLNELDWMKSTRINSMRIAPCIAFAIAKRQI